MRRHSPYRCRTPNRNRDDEAGFTLVEALVAFMIAALALTLGLRVLVNGTLWARRGPEATERIEEAASIMYGLIGERELRPGSSTGRFRTGDLWRIRVTAMTNVVDPQATTPLMRIEFFDGPEANGKPLLVTMAIGR